MVSDTALRIIVRPDFLTPIPSPYLTATGSHNFPLLLFGFALVQAGAQHPHRFVPVFELTAFFLTKYHDSTRFVQDTYGRLGFIDMLPAGTAAFQRFYLQIGWVNPDIDFLRFRQYGNRDRRV